MTGNTLYFWQETSGEAPWLSQWYHCPFYSDDKQIIYNTAEHWMMHQKALLFKDTDIAEKVLKASHPRKAKALGRQVSNFSHEVWDANRDQIVYKGNLLKFTKPVEGGTDLLVKLLDTGDRELVEASPEDRIWGVGFAAADADANRDSWGLNLLGEALTRVREELKRDRASGKADS